MEHAVAGWALFEGSASDGLAHELVSVDGPRSGEAASRSLCGQFTGPDWTPAGPGVTRCPACQDTAAGTPD